MGDEVRVEQVNRREFLAGGALLGFGWLCGAAAAQEGGRAASRVLNSDRTDAAYDRVGADRFIYSACLQCNTGCSIRAKIEDGVLVKIDGNPYSPWTLVPHLSYATPVDTTAVADGAICPKGQAGLQIAYDPYRLRKVLKRAGRRGENKWIAIPFEQAVREICEGGLLFAHVPGEE